MIEETKAMKLHSFGRNRFIYQVFKSGYWLRIVPVISKKNEVKMK